MMLGMMAVLTLTALSGAAPVAAAPSPSASTSSSHNSLAASSSTAGANWAFVDDGIAATNWSNQTQINAANAASMQVDWVVPFPNVDLTWKQAPGASWSTEPGSSAPPLIVNGIVYVVSDQGTVYAMSATDGSILWSSSVTLNYTRALQQVPIFETQVANHALVGCGSIAADKNTTCIFRTASPVMHRHGINYQDGIITVTGFACEIWGFNATTGATSFHIGNICVNVPGNPVGSYPATYTSDPPEVYNSPSGPILIYAMGAYTDSAGRSFVTAYNLNAVEAQCKAAGAACNGDNAGNFWNAACAAGSFTPSSGPGGSGGAGTTLEGTCAPATAGQGNLWMVFENPPNPSVIDTNWDNEACNIGMVFDYPAWRANGSLGRTCASLPASVKANDWGSPKGVDGTVSTTWGQYVLNNKTAMLYIGTGEESPYPYYNPSVRPGLNLYGSALFAINMTSGTLSWWYQMDPHDVQDWDASWAPVLGQAGGQAAVFKATKLGILYAWNSLTGKPIWAFENPAVFYGPCVPSGQMPSMTTWANGNPVSGKTSGNPNYGKDSDVSCLAMGSPLNANWLQHPYATWPDVNATYVALPAATGSLESDVSFAVIGGQPMIFGSWMNQPGSVSQANPKTGGSTGIRALNNPINTTLTAIFTNNINSARNEPNIAWSHYYANFLFRSANAITNGMVVMPGGDGNVHFLNATNGIEVDTLHTGASLFVANTLGLTSSGQVRMLTIFGGGRWSAAGTLGGGAEVPGGIMAWGLPAPSTGNPNGQSITGQTITTTVNGATSTIIKSGSTVTLATATVVGTSTVTQPAGTVTSTIVSSTGTSGISATTFYVVAGIAVIFVIATGALAVMRRKPSAT